MSNHRKLPKPRTPGGRTAKSAAKQARKTALRKPPPCLICREPDPAGYPYGYVFTDEPVCEACMETMVCDHCGSKGSDDSQPANWALISDVWLCHCCTIFCENVWCSSISPADAAGWQVYLRDDDPVDICPACHERQWKSEN